MADFSYVQESLIASMTDDSEDSCSICLEPFNLHDPSTVTNCKHEYHLHCILEWSQLSKECCWQSLALKDPASQELLAAVNVERSARRRNTRTNISTYPPPYQESDSEYVSRWTDDPDFNDRIMQHLAAMMSQARQGHENERQVPSRVSDSTLHPNTPEEWSSANGSSGCSSPTASISSVDAQPALSPSPSFISLSPGPVPKRDTHCHSRSLPSQSSDSTQRQRSSELLAFSESIKSRLSATSARYKDSISKGTQGFREKFLPRNIAVKELSTGVQREMNAGIAGVARMMERLDLSFKRNLRAGEGCTHSREASNFFSKGKGVLDDIIANSFENHVVTNKETVSQEKTQPTCSIESLKDVYHTPERRN